MLLAVQISLMLTPVAARSKACVCRLSLAGTLGSNPAVGKRCLSVVSVVYCHIEASTSGRSLVQGSPTECVTKCDHESSKMRRPWPTGAVAPW